MLNWLLTNVPSLSSAGPWLSRKGALYAVLLGFVFAIFLISIGCIPSIPAEVETNMPWWRISYLVGFPAAFIILWLLVTQSYLRTGRGTKIGLAYDGHKVNVADWKRTRATLRDLLKNGQIKSRVSLRFVPFRATTIDERATVYMKRYQFTILTAVQQSPALEETGRGDDQQPVFSKINLRIATKAAARQFLQVTLKHSLEIIQKRKAGPTLADVLEADAHNLHDMMLLFVASHCFLQKEYKDSSAILGYLDKSLSQIMDPDQNPRRQIRWLAMESCLLPTEFSVLEIPSYDRLMDIREFAETALPYFNDSYLVPIGLARIRFLTGDVEGAIKLTEQYGKKIDEIRGSGKELTDRVLPTYNLNWGFLSFIQGHWVNAYNAYNDMLSVETYRKENWNEYIDFIDYVNNLELYDGICYLQCLYRLIAKKAVTHELRDAALIWVSEDESRKELRTLLSRNYPSLINKSEEKDRRREQQRHIKQRSKRKRKPRKKKRG